MDASVKKPDDIDTYIADLEVLQEKCNRDIQCKNESRAHAYLAEYNRILTGIRQFRSEATNGFEPINVGFLERWVDDADTRIRLKSRIDHDASKLLRRIHDYEETSPEILAYKLFQGMGLHKKVVKASEGLFKDGYYSAAIFEAFKIVEIAVKNKSGLTISGRELMSQAFSPSNPRIKLNDLQTETDKDEQEGFRFLFMGATQGIRNPKAHENIVQSDPYKALEYLALASLLLKKIDL